MDPHPQNILTLPTPPPGCKLRNSTLKAICQVKALENKNMYATSIIQQYKNKIEQLQSQIEIWNQRKIKYNKDLTAAIRNTQSRLEDDIEDFLESN